MGLKDTFISVDVHSVVSNKAINHIWNQEEYFHYLSCCQHVSLQFKRSDYEFWCFSLAVRDKLDKIPQRVASFGMWKICLFCIFFLTKKMLTDIGFVWFCGVVNFIKAYSDIYWQSKNIIVDSLERPPSL